MSYLESLISKQTPKQQWEWEWKKTTSSKTNHQTVRVLPIKPTNKQSDCFRESTSVGSNKEKWQKTFQALEFLF